MKALSISKQGQRPVLSIIPCGFHLLLIEGLRMARHECPCRQHGQVGMRLLRQRLSLACLEGVCPLGSPGAINEGQS